MKLFLFLVPVIFVFSVRSQDISFDTLKCISAGFSSFSLLPVLGPTSAGGAYGVGVNLIFSENGKPAAAELVRIDFAKKSVTYITIPEIMSANGALWVATTAPSGEVYLSVNVPKRKIIRLNFKDSIQYKDLGNAFQDSSSLAYSMSVGTDGKMYFGGSSGDTYWSSLDLKTQRFEKHDVVDPKNDYLLSITGDSNYVYAQTGQRNSVELWSVRKADDKKKLLFKVPNTIRINVQAHTDGVYASLNTDTLSGSYKLVNGDAVKLKTSVQSKQIGNVNTDLGVDTKSRPVFDATGSKIYFFVNNKVDSISIRARNNKAVVKELFAFQNDKRYIYYTGDYYGNYYRYDLQENKSVLLGSTGLNLYSTLVQNDSMLFFGGYPSGYLMRWNRNQPWTTNRVIKGKLVAPGDKDANPAILGYWKSQGKPLAGFHHTYEMLFDKNKNIVGAGNVIRIGNAASIGVYNTVKDSLYGIKYDPFTGLSFRDLGAWKNDIIYSMRGSAGKKPKLYFYNPVKNIMRDSIDFGFDDYGIIYIKGNVLYGIAHNRIYQADLKKKKLIKQISSPDNSISSAHFLSNGTAIVQSGRKLQIPFLKIYQLKYAVYLETNDDVYAIDGMNIIRLKDVLKTNRGRSKN